MVDSVNNTAGTSTSTTGASKSLAGLADNFDNFLVLLTTQLKNQDPTAPMDTNDFTSQLVSFTGVEQAVNTNSNLEKLISLTKTNQTNDAVGYLGKTVEVEGSAGSLTNGKAEFFYNIEEDADYTSILITDQDGRLVKSIDGNTKAGKSSLAWDGKSESGRQMPDGMYNILVKAVDAQGNEIKTSTTVTSTVNGVTIKDGSPMLTLTNTLVVPVSNVVSVRDTLPAEDPVDDSLQAYVGKTVEVPSNKAALADGQAQMLYKLDKKATSVSISITNKDGDIVKTLNGEVKAGKNTITWDGKGENGAKMPDGLYTFQVKALDADGKEITTTTSIKDVVASAEVKNGVSLLTLKNSLVVPVSSVITA